MNIKKPEKLVESQRELCVKLGLKGRMLLANEGVNATFEGRVRDINKYKKALRSLKINGKELFKDIVFKESEGNGKAFTKLEIKVRDEVVTLGKSDFNIKRSLSRCCKKISKIHR